MPTELPGPQLLKELGYYISLSAGPDWLVRGSNSARGKTFTLFQKSSIPFPGLTQLPIKWTLGPFLGDKDVGT